MAEGLAVSAGKNRVEVFSAGSRPSGWIHPFAIEAMKEAGIDITRQKSKGLRQIPQEKYEAVVTMGCGDACPQIPAYRRYDWPIADPAGSPIAAFRETREIIRGKVEVLLGELSADPRFMQSA